MAEVVTPPLDLDGQAMTAQVAEFIGGITLGAIQTQGEAMDRCTEDDDDNPVFYDADEAPEGDRSHPPPGPVGTSCEELTHPAGGEDEESSGPLRDADGSPERPESAVCEELPESLCDGQAQEATDRSLCDDRERESPPGSESAVSTEFLGAETEMLGQPQSGVRVSSGNEESEGEPLSLITAESTQPTLVESEKLPETQRDDDQSRCPETESAVSSCKGKYMCAQSLVAESEELAQPESTNTNAESSLNEESKESTQSICTESGESLKYACNVEESEPNTKPENDVSVQSVCTESGETIQPLCDHKPSELPLCQGNEDLVPSSCPESGQSTLSGSISDGQGLEPSRTQEGQSVCKASAQSDSSASVPEAASCPSRSQPETDSAMAASGTGACDASPTSQRELEETAAPDSGACPAELPGERDNNVTTTEGERSATTEGEVSRSPEELDSTSTQPQRLMSKETQTEMLEEPAAAMAQTQSEQQKTEQEELTAVEAAQEEQAAEVVTGGDEAADAAPTLGATGGSDRPADSLEHPGDLSSGDDLTADSQDEALDGRASAEAQRSQGSDSDSESGSPPSGDRASTGRIKKPQRQHSFTKSKYNTVSYRKIRKGNTRQRIDEFEAMMNL